MHKFIDKLHKNISLFINNYLIDGALAEVHGFSDIDYVFYEKYPYLCLAYLLNANSLLDDYNKFIEDHKNEIILEISTLEKLIGTSYKFSPGNIQKESEIRELKQSNDELKSRCSQLSEEIRLLKEKSLKNEKEIRGLTSRLSHYEPNPLIQTIEQLYVVPLREIFSILKKKESFNKCCSELAHENLLGEISH